MVTARRLSFGALAAFATTACRPNLDETVSIVSSPVVLAVRSDPAEVPPEGKVTYTVLLVDASGRRSSTPIEWAFCNARKPLAELGPFNTECLDTSGSWFAPLGVGPQTSGPIPQIACKQFGPDVPMVQQGQLPSRPVDPDATGGYYQPVRLIAPIDGKVLVAMGETRLACGLVGASPDLLAEFQDRYHPNLNPEVASLGVIGGALFQMDDHGATNRVQAGARLPLRVAWTSCPSRDTCGDGVCGPDETAKSCTKDCPSMETTPVGCTGAERFVALPLASEELTDLRESIAVAWFATGGSFDSDRTGRDSTDLTTTSDDVWRAPDAPGPVHMWIVLRDSRGGVGWGEYVLDVR